MSNARGTGSSFDLSAMGDSNALADKVDYSCVLVVTSRVVASWGKLRNRPNSLFQKGRPRLGLPDASASPHPPVVLVRNLIVNAMSSS